MVGLMLIIFQRYFRLLLIPVTMLAGGCSFYPVAGPNSLEIRNGENQGGDRLPYALVKMTPRVIDVLALDAPRIAGVFPDRRAPGEIRFGVGDVVAITIFEAQAGGLFIPAEASVRPGNFIALPNQAVDHNGYVNVPYAGNVRAKGRTPAEVSQAIVEALKNRAIEPQAVVSLIEQRTSLISVLGEVNTPARFPASASGEHVLDAITRAGGPKGQGFDTWIMLERNNRRAIAPFGALVYEPSNNIFVHPDDLIYVYREPQTFVVFGAAGQQGQFNFEAWRVSVAEGVAKAGGLNDTLADPKSIFLYRGETREVATQLGVDVTRFEGPIIPIIYNVNFRDPAGYFLATKMQMRNKDVIYTSNAQAVEVAKALQFFRLVVATANDPIVTATNAYVLKNTAAAVNGGGGGTTIVTTTTPATTP
jgi:polysaccharide biosynthesis/export protein